jgi:hypothetical protein
MTRRTPDPFDELRHADPVHSAPAPSESKARVWARVQEVTMDRSVSPHRTPTGLALGLAGLAAAAIAVALLTGEDATPAPSEPPGPGIGSCVETYTLDTLENRDFAFDGTVTAIDGDAVTFTVIEAFAGDVTDPVTLTASAMTGTSVTTAGGPSLAMDQRYLVAGDETFAWACGFTQPYESAVAAEWRAVTR